MSLQLCAKRVAKQQWEMTSVGGKGRQSAKVCNKHTRRAVGRKSGLRHILHLELLAAREAVDHGQSLDRRRLRHLVPATPDRDEGEVVVGVAGGVAAHLLGAVVRRRVRPHVPRGGLLVAHARRPGDVVRVRHARVPVTVVDQHLQVLHQQRVRVPGKVGTVGVVRPALGRGAGGPREVDGLHVHGGDHGRLVEVVRGVPRVQAGVGSAELRAVELRLAEGRGALDLRRVDRVDALAVDVVQVDVAQSLVHLLDQGAARGARRLPVARGRDVGLLLVRDEAGVQEQLRVELVTLRAARADRVTGAAVADGDAVELGARVRTVADGPEDGLGERGHVDSAVRLTRDVEGVALELGVAPEEGLDGVEVVLRRNVVVLLVVHARQVAVAEADAHRGLDVDHVRHLGPAGRVGHQLRRVALLVAEGAVLVVPAVQRRAAGTAVHPEDGRRLRVGGVLARALHVVVVDVLAGAGPEAQVAGVLLRRQSAGPARKGRDLVLRHRRQGGGGRKRHHRRHGYPGNEVQIL
eukprot:Rhum_TRINITY_DN15375_c12_g1::Rhum_TRINITY_DN15375_c12_g1_i1::g.154681::m.154681